MPAPSVSHLMCVHVRYSSQPELNPKTQQNGTDFEQADTLAQAGTICTIVRAKRASTRDLATSVSKFTLQQMAVDEQRLKLEKQADELNNSLGALTEGEGSKKQGR